MAGAAPRVRYMAGFRCPLGGLAASKPRVLCHEAEVFLSTGRELVYVYDQEGGLLTAAFRFPDQVRHLELLAPRRLLYALCARRGLYCLSPDRPGRSRSTSQDDGDSEDSDQPCPVIPVDPDACVLPDAALCAFTVLDSVLVTLVQGPARWKMQLFERPSPGEDARPGGQIGEVELSTYTPPAGVPGKPAAPHFLPVLCCVSPSGSRVPHDLGGSGGFSLEDALFGLLFGADATLLQSPVVLCGLPDGQLCCVILKALVTSSSAPGDPNGLVKILHHLEEPVIFIGALKTEPPAAEAAENLLPDEDVHSDCLVALGHQGRMLAIKASWDESGKLVPELREYHLPGPVLCAACGGGGLVYYSTPSDLFVVDLSRGSTPLSAEQPDEGPGGLPPMLCPASLNICSAVSLSVSPRMQEGGTELLALSAKGRLLTCTLDLESEMPGSARMTAESAGRKIKELLSGIGNISERVSFLKKAVDQRNKALTSLNEAMNVSCALLSSGAGPRPISCTTSTTWSRLQTQDVLMATCVLENRSDFSLDQGWTLCIQVLTSSRALDLDSACSAITYTIPVDRLGPGTRREVTLPLGPGTRWTCCNACASLAWPRHTHGPPPRSAPRVTLWPLFWNLVGSRAASQQDPPPCGLSTCPHLWLPSRCQRSCSGLRWRTVTQVAMTDICPAGPIQAVEIQMESSSLADMCRAHHAIIGRMQTMVTEQAAQGSSAPDLRVQYLRQIHANHETLLREVQTLRDRLCTEDEASSCATAQRLLQVYRQLRHPSLVLL
ncbi:Fanconi anemia core complex-associated protein 100 isoform X4 [Sapajus apella]|uniref:Fanconi anemia core complex-associated protein 100 isoform X4 n=1 Tax=Sapajus apella TaxID=9515 RepID=A0A6J3EWI5_SAPAP|nr:Fanconi anemia core complex-associated protein 100 isoform X4 [Sapajus apella]